jgi:hypothetical protein
LLLLLRPHLQMRACSCTGCSAFPLLLLVTLMLLLLLLCLLRW